MKTTLGLELRKQLVYDGSRTHYRTVYNIRNVGRERMGEIKLGNLTTIVQKVGGKTWVPLSSLPSRTRKVEPSVLLRLYSEPEGEA